MKKKYVILSCVILALWFFLDMTGVYIGNQYLVTRSFKEDGLFFVIYIIMLLVFIFKERIGKYLLNIWLILWLASSFLFHWLVTITNNNAVSKIEYFKGSIKLINSSTRYIPDLYHIILHLLILLNVIVLNIYLSKENIYRKNKTALR